MADEIRFIASLECSNGSLKASQKKDIRADQTTRGAWSGIQNIGTSEEVLVVSGVTSARAVLIENLDEENFVDIGPELTGAMVAWMRLYPGDVALVPLKPSVVTRAKADTAAVDVAYTLVNV